MEIFYDCVVTPAIRLIPSYQHIWNPLLAQFDACEEHHVFLARLTMNW
jgi:porin